MFAKLGDYLDEHKIQRPLRYVSSTGEQFVVLPARDYAILTGIDTNTLPTVEAFDTVSDTGEEHMEEESDSGQLASALASLPLEEEMSVDNLPL